MTSYRFIDFHVDDECVFSWFWHEEKFEILTEHVSWAKKHRYCLDINFFVQKNVFYFLPFFITSSLILNVWQCLVKAEHLLICCGYTFISKKSFLQRTCTALVLQTGSTYLKLWGVLLAHFRIHNGILAVLSSALQPLIFPFLQQNPQVTQYIQTLRWPLSTHAPWLESFMFSRIPLGVRKTLLHGGGVTSCGTYGHQSGQRVIPPTASSADPLGWKSSRWAIVSDVVCY